MGFFREKRLDADGNIVYAAKARRFVDAYKTLPPGFKNPRQLLKAEKNQIKAMEKARKKGIPVMPIPPSELGAGRKYGPVSGQPPPRIPNNKGNLPMPPQS